MKHILKFSLFEDKKGAKEPKKEEDHLFFNGNRLDFIIDGKVAKSWKALSGRSPYHWWINPSIWKKRYTISHDEWAKAKNEGPTPPGKYKLGKTQSRSIPDKWLKDSEYVKKILSRTTASSIPGSNVKDEPNHEFIHNTDNSYVAWGNYRWLLIPEKGTNTHGRNSFYLHGGSTPGSIGCIDLVTETPAFAKFYEEWQKKTKKTTIPVIVDYKTFDKNVAIDVDSQPFKMKPYKNDKEWYATTNATVSDTLAKNKIEVDPKILSLRRP